MIIVYRVKYLPATETRGSGFTVTRMSDKKSKRTTFNHGATSAEKWAVHEAFNHFPADLELVGRLAPDSALYAISK